MEVEDEERKREREREEERRVYEKRQNKYRKKVREEEP
jgi:hypothetical protein